MSLVRLLIIPAACLACGLLSAGCTPAIRVAPPEQPPWQAEGYIPGNAVRMLANGPDTYRAMHEDIFAARHHIHVQTYILCDDGIGRAFTEWLARRAESGVAVRLMYDYHGAEPCTDKSFFKRLRERGVELLALNPPRRGDLVHPLEYHQRDHRKLLIVDGRVAYTGGINFDDAYAASPRVGNDPDQGWRDTNVRVEGPAAAEFQTLFLQRWREHRPLPELASQQYYPAPRAAGDAKVRMLVSLSKDPPTHNPIYAAYIGAIEYARERVWLTHSYFAPEPGLMRALLDAAARGVDVRLVLPGFSDVPLLYPVAQASYERLLAGGVKIYERRDAFVHAKTLVVDGHWTLIGSANLDYRSFLHNDEVNAMILDRALARRMEALFLDDVAHAVPVRLEDWRRRPPTQRMKEWLALIAAYWL